jgi:hypothetical protein
MPNALNKLEETFAAQDGATVNEKLIKKIQIFQYA